MPTTSPWSRLHRRVKASQDATSKLPEQGGIRASANVQRLQKLRDAVDAEIDREIIEARKLGAPWHAIGYGTSKQAAQQRHARAERDAANAAMLRRFRSGDRADLLR